MRVFRTFSRFIEVIQQLETTLVNLEHTLHEIVEAQKELGPARERLEVLELSRAHFEAEMQALVLKADGKFKAANNAEARERQLKRSYERIGFVDPLVEDGAEREKDDAVSTEHAAASEAARLQALSLVVAPHSKALAQRAKWGT